MLENENAQLQEDQEVENENDKCDVSQGVSETNDELLERLAATEAKAADLEQQFLRMTADFVNYRKRMAKEQAAIYQNANAKLIKRILPVLDNFERAIEAGEDKQLSGGIVMIYKQLKEILEDEGLEVIKAEGQEFDPHFHEAMLQESNDEFEDSTVLQVFEKGYLFKDKLLRPAKVKVSCK